MAGLDPATTSFLQTHQKTWIPGMTTESAHSAKGLFAEPFFPC